MQYWPNQFYQNAVLSTAQTAYFVGVVVARVADLYICKTRKESIFNQGIRNRVSGGGRVGWVWMVSVLRGQDRGGGGERPPMKRMGWWLSTPVHK